MSGALENGADPADEPLLRTEGLTKRFGEFAAVDRVSIEVERGEFRSIIGPNGAGKTMLFNLVSGTVRADAGSVVLAGEDITDLPPHRRVDRGLARSFQITSVFDHLSVRENVRLAVQSTVYGGFDLRDAMFTPTERFGEITERVDDVLARVELDSRADVAAAELAYGQKRALEVGLVLALDPDLVLLDEPTAGMSSDETYDMIELVEEVFADRTLVVVEHDIDLVMALSDTVTVLHQGRVLDEGAPESISESEAVQEAYLGGRR